MTTDHSHLFIGAVMRKLGVDTVELNHDELEEVRRNFRVSRYDVDAERKIIVKIAPQQK